MSDSRAPAQAPSVRAAAVVTVHDELVHVDGVLAGLIAEGLDVVVLDHGSVDGSGERADAWVGRGVLWVQREPFDGEYRLRDLLLRREQIYAALDHDWVLHVDADEWLCTHRVDERLIDLFARADAANANAIDFDEFVFVPDVPLPDGADPRRVFCCYYHFAPTRPRLMRARRRDAGLSAVDGAGHLLRGPELRLHDEAGILRHYPVLSEAHGAAKYFRRRFDDQALADGWHANRVNLAPDAFVLRPSRLLRRLSRWDARDFDASAPSRHHFWERAWGTSPADLGPGNS